jgi:tRNA dimethylallyltransferase
MRTREDRYARIERRVEELLARGWVEEVRQLHESPAGGFGKVARQAVGYAEILDHLAGRLGYDDMVLAIKTRTRQMSKRQMTWFRHMEECVPIDVAADEPKEAIVERLASFFTSPDQDDK